MFLLGSALPHFVVSIDLRPASKVPLLQHWDRAVPGHEPSLVEWARRLELLRNFEPLLLLFWLVYAHALFCYLTASHVEQLFTPFAVSGCWKSGTAGSLECKRPGKPEVAASVSNQQDLMSQNGWQPADPVTTHEQDDGSFRETKEFRVSLHSWVPS